MSPNIAREISQYLATIGARGGTKRRTHPKRALLAKNAAVARWTRVKAEMLAKQTASP